MITRWLGGAVAALLLVSCNTLISPVGSLASVNKTDKAYIVMEIVNKTKGGGFGLFTMPVRVTLISGLKTAGTYSFIQQNGKQSLLVYEAKPGTFRIDQFRVTDDKGSITYIYDYSLDPVFQTYFTVRPGEVAYLGTFTLEGSNPSLTTSIDLDRVQEAAAAKNPLFEGYRWFSLIDDRPSFY